MRNEWLILAMAGVTYAAFVFGMPARPAYAETKSEVDFAGFEALTREVSGYRDSRLVGLADFQRMAGEDDTLILDARSAEAYGQGHIQGAVNLPFPDFTAQRLAEVIGDPDRRVLIYCNNNFANDAPPVVLKRIELALNIPTFINLYGYGYRNLYELADLVDFDDPAVRWIRAENASNSATDITRLKIAQ